MKVKASVKPICDKCKVIKRKGKKDVILRRSLQQNDILKSF